jgi:Tol biopolymer transport system component
MQRGVWMPCRVVPFDGSSEGRRVTPDGQCTSVAWSPDGRWVYYSSNVGGGFHIWRAPAAGGAPEQITTGLTEEEGIALAPDGRSLFTSIGSRQQALWLHDGKGDRAVSTEGFAFVPRLPSALVQPSSSDGTKVVYLVRRGAGRIRGATERDGELRMTDLVTGHSEALMPGFNVVGFDMSRDMQQIVFAALDEKGASHLWLSRVDRQLPPRRIASIEADNPRFGANGEVFCNSVEAVSGRAFIYRIPSDGGEPRKAVDAPVQFFNSVSSDSAWLLYSVPADAGKASQLVAHAIASGETIPVCSACQGDWTADSKGLVLWMRVTDVSPFQTIVLAIEPGRMLPRLPVNGVTSTSDLSAMTVLSTTEALAFPVGTTGQYLSMRETIQRNIYRVPLK